MNRALSHGPVNALEAPGLSRLQMRAMTPAAKRGRHGFTKSSPQLVLPDCNSQTSLRGLKTRPLLVHNYLFLLLYLPFVASLPQCPNISGTVLTTCRTECVVELQTNLLTGEEGLTMKRIAIALLTSAAVVGLSQVASAAELAVKAAPPPPAPVPTWTGLYIGVHGGAAWQSTPTWNVTDPTRTLASQSITGNSTLGAVGGLQAGYNWQVLPVWVLGVEGDISWTSLQNQTTNRRSRELNGVHCAGAQLTVQMSQNERWLASVRGKVGFTGWWNNTMLYATGGIAWANAEYTGRQPARPACGRACSSAQQYQRHHDQHWLGCRWRCGMAGDHEHPAPGGIPLLPDQRRCRTNRRPSFPRGGASSAQPRRSATPCPTTTFRSPA